MHERCKFLSVPIVLVSIVHSDNDQLVNTVILHFCLMEWSRLHNIMVPRYVDIIGDLTR